MIDLKPQTPFDGFLPVTFGETTLRELSLGWITSLSPYPGRENAANVALKVAHGPGFPAPGQTTGKAGARAQFGAGRGRHFLIGPEPDKSLSKAFAMTDQSDAWAVAEITGPNAQDVLARLCPLDLRPTVFKRGHTARSLIGHMNAQITRTRSATHIW